MLLVLPLDVIKVFAFISISISITESTELLLGRTACLGNPALFWLQRT